MQANTHTHTRKHTHTTRRLHSLTSPYTLTSCPDAVGPRHLLAPYGSQGRAPSAAPPATQTHSPARPVVAGKSGDFYLLHICAWPVVHFRYNMYPASGTFAWPVVAGNFLGDTYGLLHFWLIIIGSHGMCNARGSAFM